MLEATGRVVCAYMWWVSKKPYEGSVAPFTKFLQEYQKTTQAVEKLLRTLFDPYSGAENPVLVSFGPVWHVFWVCFLPPTDSTTTFSTRWTVPTASLSTASPSHHGLGVRLVVLWQCFECFYNPFAPDIYAVGRIQ